MDHVRTALYLDFDNVFSILLKLDPSMALRFARDPGVWLQRLSTALTVDGPRRWLILRCYLNPAGSVPHPERASGPRLYFSEFRPAFTQAGFDVIDCPKIGHAKNAADVRLVVDAMEALRGDTRYEEFVIASGDSDMTPLLVKLRSEDRRTTIVSPSDAAAAFVAVADRGITGVQLLELVQGEAVDEDNDVDREVETTVEPVPEGASRPHLDPGQVEAMERATAVVRKRYAGAPGPLNLATLSNDLRHDLGGVIDETTWFGAGGFVRFLGQLGLSGARFSQHYLWDAGRHVAPTGRAQDGPPVFGTLAPALSLPRLKRADWGQIYRALAEYVSTHAFNLTEATRWTRDLLAERGVTVSRQSIAFVAQGAAYGGCPLFREPAPTAEEIRAAFVDNVLKRATAAGIQLDRDETRQVTDWLSGGDAS